MYQNVTTHETLDMIIARLVNVPAWNINQFDEATKTVSEFYQVDGSITHDLVVKEGGLREQVQAIPAQIMHWGRWAAQTKRIWQILEHKYRIWRSAKTLELSDPEEKPQGWKKPTIAQVDSTIRTDPKYETWYTTIERAEEAYNSTQAVYEGFKAKKEMLVKAVIKHAENSAPMLSI